MKEKVRSKHCQRAVGLCQMAWQPKFHFYIRNLHFLSISYRRPALSFANLVSSPHYFLENINQLEIILTVLVTGNDDKDID
jgi:hypothetical protein